MKPLKNGNEVVSTMKSTPKYVFVAPGAIAKGRGKGLKSLSSLRMSRATIPVSSSTDQVIMQYNQIAETKKGRGEEQGINSMSTIQETRTIKKNPLVLKKGHMQTSIPSFSSTEEVVQYIQTVGKGDLRKERGLRDLCSFEDAENDEGSFHQNAHHTSQSMARPSNSTKSDSTMPAVQGLQTAAQGLRTMNKRTLVHEEEHVRADIPISPSTDHVMQFTQTVGASSKIPGNTQGLQTMKKRSLVHEKEHVRADISISPSTGHVMQSTQTVGTSDLRKERGLRDMCSFEHAEEDEGSFHRNAQGLRTATQGLRKMNKRTLVDEEEHVRADIPISSSTDHVMQSTQTVGASSKIPGKVKKGRGSNKCKEIASLEVGQKLKVTFYNNRTVGKNSNLFSRHLGKIIRDRNMCSLAISSWDDIKEEKLNHMWAAVKDKFESDDMNIHRGHILGWMKELWNKWRGKLHAKYVKDKPIQEALKNVPKGIDKRQWEWLLKEHFSTEKFQARSSRNAANRAKLKMLPRTGSKPIREIIYQKGGKDGNPPDFATVFFETGKKNNTLVDSEAIEKHAEIQELVQTEPSLPSIEIVEKCFGPQTRSHVFGFGGGVKAKDLKGGTASKAELWSELRSTREENQSLKDRLSNVENEMKEMKKLKDWILSQHSNFQDPTSDCSGE